MQPRSAGPCMHAPAAALPACPAMATDPGLSGAAPPASCLHHTIVWRWMNLTQVPRGVQLWMHNWGPSKTAAGMVPRCSSSTGMQAGLSGAAPRASCLRHSWLEAGVKRLVLVSKGMASQRRCTACKLRKGAPMLLCGWKSSPSKKGQRSCLASSAPTVLQVPARGYTVVCVRCYCCGNVHTSCRSQTRRI